MAKDFYVVYPANTAASDSDYIVGKAQNESWDGAKDWFPLEATWVNELLGFWSALLDAAGFTPDGNAENISASQYLDAINALPVSVSRLTNGDVVITDANFKFGGDVSGSVRMYSNPAGPIGSIINTAPNTKTYIHRTLMSSGVITFDTNSGTSHNFHSVLRAIDEADVSMNVATPNYIAVASKLFTGLAFSEVWKTELIMKNATNIATLPLVAFYTSASGTLQLDSAHCVLNAATSITVSGYDDFYINMWVDFSAIS